MKQYHLKCVTFTFYRFLKQMVGLQRSFVGKKFNLQL